MADKVLESRIPLPIVSVKIRVQPLLPVSYHSDAHVKFYTTSEVFQGFDFILLNYL